MADHQFRELNQVETNNQFLKFVQAWTHYLNDYGYCVTPACILDFYKVVDLIDILNINELCGISKVLFARNQIEYESHDDFFGRFLDGYMKETLDSMVVLEQEAVNLRIQQIQEDYRQAQYELENKMRSQQRLMLSKVVDGRVLTVREHVKILETLSVESQERLFQYSMKMNVDLDRPDLVDLLLLNETKMLEWVTQRETFPYDELKSACDAFMVANLTDTNPSEEITELLVLGAATLQKINTMLQREEREHTKIRVASQSNYTELIRTVEGYPTETQSAAIVKDKTLNHRVGEFKGKNSVIDLSRIHDKSVSVLSDDEYESLLSYIHLNAAKFRTKLSRSMKQSTSKTFDYQSTMRNSIKTYGTPMTLCYKRPIIKKYKLICFLDVSGSVSRYLKLLSSFLYEINSVFSGGVHTFGFVSDLFDFTEVFRNETVDRVLDVVSGLRGYSDYNRALQDFNDNHLNLVDSNTIILFFGDGRNNQNPTGEGYLLEIQKRSRGIVWLNPEVKEKWFSGDSEMKTYERIVSRVCPANQTHDLIRFMEEFSAENLK